MTLPDREVFNVEHLLHFIHSLSVIVSCEMLMNFLRF